MAVDKLVDSTQLNSDLTSIANAIRTKGGTSAQLAFPSGFVTAIGAISTGGGGSIVITDETNATGTTAVITGNEITLTTKTINQNGTYNASSDNADGYSAVTVNVSSGGSTTWETVYNGSVSITDWGDELYYVQLRDYFSEHAGFVYGETYRVTWKGYPYICDVQEQIDYYGAGDTYCIGNATLGGGTTGNNEPFFAMPWYDNLMFATTDSSGTFTLTIEKQVSSGGSPSATQHSIYFEFSDNTNTTIPVYYNDALLSTMITAYTPETYSGKMVDLAQLDGVTWYERPTETFETLWDGITNYYYEDNGSYPYVWITELVDIEIPVGSVWKVTVDDTTYRVVGKSNVTGGFNGIGNPKYVDGVDDGSDVPFVLYPTPWGAWTGSLDKPNQNGTCYLKIERQVSS